jgi:hypothetical protein
MLKVGIEGYEVTGPFLQGERNPSLQGSALAEVNRVAHKPSASSSREHRCCIGGAIINDNDVWTESSQPQNDFLNRLLLIESGNNDPNRGRQYLF